ncbi:hypothetical protein E3P94_02728 [Wallemia ichthyophaga]|nr:hypothetical protein E3P95_02677 [Wallemia ichthyophaga]TIA99103.1 hypothetical protein E3P94_02728 [Wallemia ichthyophaga]
MLKSKSLTALFSLRQTPPLIKLRVVFDNPESRATPFTVSFPASYTVRDLKAEIVKQEKLRGRGDLFELIDDEELLLNCIRIYKTQIDVGAEAQFRQHNKQHLQNTSILSYFEGSYLSDDDMQVSNLIKRGKKGTGGWVKRDDIIHLIARVVPFANDTHTLLASFQDDISIQDKTPPIIVDADGDWTVGQLKKTLIRADGRAINPAKTLIYATDCVFSPGTDSSLMERAAKVPLRVESLKISNFFPPTSHLDRISIVVSFDVKDLPAKVRYEHPRRRFVYDPRLTTREKPTKWKPSKRGAMRSGDSDKEDGKGADKKGMPTQPFMSLPQLDFDGVDRVNRSNTVNDSHTSHTSHTPRTPTDDQQLISKQNEPQYNFLGGDSDTSASLAIALASFDKQLVL